MPTPAKQTYVSLAIGVGMLALTACSPSASAPVAKVAVTARASDGSMAAPQAPDTTRFGAGWSPALPTPVTTDLFLPGCGVQPSPKSGSTQVTTNGPGSITAHIISTANQPGSAHTWLQQTRQALAGCSGTANGTITQIPSITGVDNGFAVLVGSNDVIWFEADNATNISTVTHTHTPTPIDPGSAFAIWSANVADASVKAAESQPYGPLPNPPDNPNQPADSAHIAVNGRPATLTSPASTHSPDTDQNAGEGDDEQDVPQPASTAGE